MGEKTSVEMAAREWISLKEEKIRLENRFEELRDVLEPYLTKQPEKKAEIAGFRFTLIETEKENFKLSAAKENIDGRTLAPYITRSKFTQIRTSWQGGEEKAA